MRKKVLIIKISALGDVCLALPHIEVILTHHQDDEVWIMTSPAFHDLFINHPRLKTVILDRADHFGLHGALARILWVRRQRFDAIYELQGNRTSRLLARFSGAATRVGTQPYGLFTQHPQEMYTIHTQQSIYDRLNDTLRAAGLPEAEPKATLYPFPGDSGRVQAWLDQNKLAGEKIALLHAGCSPEWPSKQWPLASFLALAQMIEQAGISCVWVGGQEDRGINSRLAASVGVDATGGFPLLQLYLLGGRAQFAVTNDSGPMHILALAGIPVFSFFGPTNWVRSHAAGQQERVLHNQTPCSPCFLKQCPLNKKHACLAGISPAEAFSRINAENLFYKN